MKEIVDIFDQICLPFDNGNGQKEEKFLELLEEHGAHYHEKVGIIVPTVNGVAPSKVIVSHMDLIPLFNKGFTNGRKYLLEKDELGEEILIGALDNSITNATLILAINELRRNGLAHDVEFVFTEGEEIDFLGMKEYLKIKSKDPFFINLDVTNDNYKRNSSVEYDYPNFHICKQLCEGLFEAGYQKERVDDDFDAIKAVGGKGFSYCLPTMKNIHSYKNTTHVSKLKHYYDGLKFLITDLVVEEVEHNIVHHSIKKALKHKDFKSFKKAEKKLKKKIEKRREKEAAKRAKEREKWASSGSGSSERFQSSLDFGDDFDYYEPSRTRRRYLDTGGGLVDEDDFDFRVPQGFNDGFEYYDDQSSIISEKDIIELDNILQASFVALSDYDIDVTKDEFTFVRKFVADHVFAQDQWTIDDLAGFTGDLTLSKKVIEALDDYFLIDTIEEGVYSFVKKSPYA